MNDNFSIATGIETVAAGLQLTPQLGKIVDFSIENHPDTLILVVYRLVPAGHINDAQPPHAQPYAIAHIEPVVVRPPMHDGVAHKPHKGFGDLALPLCANHSSDATHEL